VQVLEYEHERSLLCQRLQEAAPRGESVRAAVCCGVFGLEPDERAQVPLKPATILLARDGHGHRRPQLRLRLVRVVGLEDPGLRLDDLGERPEGDTVAVGERAAVPPVDEVRPLLDRPEQLVDHPALADPPHTDERDELRLAFAVGAIEHLAQER
jgi:hypothetical protein